MYHKHHDAEPSSRRAASLGARSLRPELRVHFHLLLAPAPCPRRTCHARHARDARSARRSPGPTDGCQRAWSSADRRGPAHPPRHGGAARWKRSSPACWTNRRRREIQSVGPRRRTLSTARDPARLLPPPHRRGACGRQRDDRGHHPRAGAVGAEPDSGLGQPQWAGAGEGARVGQRGVAGSDSGHGPTQHEHRGSTANRTRSRRPRPARRRVSGDDRDPRRRLVERLRHPEHSAADRRRPQEQRRRIGAGSRESRHVLHLEHRGAARPGIHAVRQPGRRRRLHDLRNRRRDAPPTAPAARRKLRVGESAWKGDGPGVQRHGELPRQRLAHAAGRLPRQLELRPDGLQHEVRPPWRRTDHDHGARPSARSWRSPRS
jgi:hypothetical protein